MGIYTKLTSGFVDTSSPLSTYMAHPWTPGMGHICASYAFLTVLTSLKNLKPEQKISHLGIPLLKQTDLVREKVSKSKQVFHDGHTTFEKWEKWKIEDNSYWLKSWKSKYPSIGYHAVYPSGWDMRSKSRQCLMTLFASRPISPQGRHNIYERNLKPTELGVYYYWLCDFRQECEIFINHSDIVSIDVRF